MYFFFCFKHFYQAVIINLMRIQGGSFWLDGFQSRFESHKACTIPLSFFLSVCLSVFVCRLMSGFCFCFLFALKNQTFNTQKSVQIFRPVRGVYCGVCGSFVCFRCYFIDRISVIVCCFCELLLSLWILFNKHLILGV